MKKILIVICIYLILFISPTILKPGIATAAGVCDPGFHPCQCAPNGTVWYPGAPLEWKCCFDNRAGADICTGNRPTNGPVENAYPWQQIYTCGSEVLSPDGQTSHKSGIDTALGCLNVTDLTQLLPFLLRLALGAAGGVILLMLIATGYTLMTSQGNPEKLQAVKENIVSIFSGLILIGFSLVILQTIGADILKLPTFIGP